MSDSERSTLKQGIFRGALKDASDEVVTIGFPPGAPGWSPRSFKFATRDGREWLFDGKVSQGNSGGPVFRDGQVVAMVQSERDGYVRANPSMAVLEFLEGSAVTLDSKPPRRTPAAEPARIDTTEVVCDKEPNFVGVIASGTATGPVSAGLQTNFGETTTAIKLECSAWTHYPGTCVRGATSPEKTKWKAKAQLPHVPQVVVAHIVDLGSGQPGKALARVACRMAKPH